MCAMVLEAPGTPLHQIELPLPECGANDVLLKAQACGVCRTDLHLFDNELANAKYPFDAS